MALGVALVAPLTASCSPASNPHEAETPGEPAVHAYQPNGVTLGDVVTLVTPPGQTTAFDTYLVNDTGHPLEVTEARVLGVPHQPVPRLTHVALARGKNFIGVQAGWPPDAVRVAKIVGAQLPAGRSDLVAGITGSTIGRTYSAAGLVITFHDGEKAYRAVSWGGAIACMAITQEQIEGCLRSVTGDASTSCRTTFTLTERGSHGRSVRAADLTGDLVDAVPARIDAPIHGAQPLSAGRGVEADGSTSR